MPRWLGTVLVSLAGLCLVIGVGALFLYEGLGKRLRRFSYETLFLTRQPNNSTQDVVIVYMTDAASIKLQQRGGIRLRLTMKPAISWSNS